MRTASANNGQLKFLYPDEVCFVFNPNYLEIESHGVPTLTVEVSVDGASTRNKSIRVSVYDMKATVYLSRLFELMFEEPEHTRSMPIKVVVKGNGGVVALTFTTIAIWGGIAPGERFNAFGVFADDSKKRQFERNLIWYKNYPFQVSVFKYNDDVKFSKRFDGGFYGEEFTGERPTAIITEIDRFTSPSIADTTAAPAQKVVFFSAVNKILAWNGGIWCTKWVAANGLNASADIVDEKTSKPLSGIDYIITDSEGMQWIYRHDGANLVNCGLKQSSGFMTLYPKELFPTAMRNATIKYKIGDELALFSTFDRTFDYTFFKSGQTVAIVNMTISDETAGHYLRWIDTQGNLQFFLFKKGKRSLKTKPGTNNIVIRTPLRGMYFSNMKRNTNVELTVTHKCGAVHLPADMFDWVSTILTAPIIDMYLGKDIDGNEIWVPVTIQAATVEYDNKQELHDLEITFEAPSHVAQSL